MTEAGEVLWEPPADVWRTSQVGRFATWLAAERGLSFDSYPTLWEWSVTDLDAFWAAIWDYFDVQSATPYEAVLADPQGAIIAPGGRIFMAMDGDDPVGCAALLPLPDGGFEIGRMAVTENYRGVGVGRALLLTCVETATALGARRLYLEASSVLVPALSLYRSMGFRPLQHARPGAPQDDRIDIWMERPL